MREAGHKRVISGQLKISQRELAMEDESVLPTTILLSGKPYIPVPINPDDERWMDDIQEQGYSAIQVGDQETFERLISEGFNFRVQQKNTKRLAHTLAAASGQQQLLLDLLTHENENIALNPLFRDGNGDDAISTAVAAGQLSIARAVINLLCEKFESATAKSLLNRRNPQTGMNALLTACFYQRLDVLRYIESEQVDLDSVVLNGEADAPNTVALACQGYQGRFDVLREFVCEREIAIVDIDDSKKSPIEYIQDFDDVSILNNYLREVNAFDENLYDQLLQQVAALPSNHRVKINFEQAQAELNFSIEAMR